MSQEESNTPLKEKDDRVGDVQSASVSWKRAVKVTLGISVLEFLTKYILPVFVLSLVASIVIYYFISDLLGMFAPILLGIPLFVNLVIALYPKILADKERAKIEQNMHLLITVLGVLSTTDIRRIDVFKVASENEELGPLADEMGKIVKLVNTWSMSLDEACRFQAKRTPSPMFKDFLERIAYNIGAGQDMEEFLMEEQEFVMTEYKNMYTGSLEDLEVLHDLFLSMMMSIGFLIVFATIMPILTGTDPTMILFGSVVLFIFTEAGFLYGSKVKIPKDPLWYIPEGTSTPFTKSIKKSLLVSIVVSLGLIIFSILTFIGVLSFNIPSFKVPTPLYLAVPVTPLIYPGIKMKLEEKSIRKRDSQFPSFIRSLGSSEYVKKSTTTHTLKTLRKKDFGQLTPEIRKLYKRLNMRIDQNLSWEHFRKDTKSYLIKNFSQMYEKGREKGGNTKRLGNIISNNMSIMIELRQKRKQTAVTLMGVLYGMTAANTFAFIMGVQIVEVMINIVGDVNLPQSGPTGNLLHTDIYNVQEVTLIILFLVALNALINSAMMKTVDGGHSISSYVHFVAFMWVGSLTAVVTKTFVSGFISV